MDASFHVIRRMLLNSRIRLARQELLDTAANLIYSNYSFVSDVTPPLESFGGAMRRITTIPLQ
jgi:hypothetical protein